MGGTDDQNNLVDLTAKEHFIAHFLLARIHGGNQWAAIILMMGSKNKYHNSRAYEIAKHNWVKECSRIHSGKTLSKETKNRISLSMKGREITQEHRAKIRSTLLTNPQTGNKHALGHRHDDETKRRIGEASKRRHFANRCKKLNLLIESVFNHAV